MSEDGENQQQERQNNEQELATKQIQIQSKRFYIDVKENKRGRFIKFAEVGVGGRKSRIIMSMSAAAEFKNYLGEFSEHHSNLGPLHGNEANKGEGDGLLKSQTIVGDRKRYYLDLKENQRGRFLKVSMLMNRAPRAQIAIPAEGLLQFKDQLTELLDQFGTTEEQNANIKLPESKSLRADNKTFYFDCGSNPRGVFLRISEVRSYRYRTAITVPEKFWTQFCDNMKEFIEKVESERVTNKLPQQDNSEEAKTETENAAGDKK